MQGLNVAPALSPDGRRLMFLSQRDLLSVDLYLADAETGKIIRKVTNTAVDPALQQHPVHRLGRRLGARQPPLRLRRRARRIAGAGDLRRGPGPDGARDRVPRHRGDLQPLVVAGRPQNRLHGAAGRSHRPLRSRPRGRDHEAADAGRVCRPLPGMVAGRPAARVRDGPLLDAPRDPPAGELPDRRRRCGRREHPRRPGRVGWEEHQPAVGRGRLAVLRFRPQRHQQRVPGTGGRRRGTAGHEPRYGRERDHGHEPRHLLRARRAAARGVRLPGRAAQPVRHRGGTAPGRRRADRPRQPAAGPTAAAAPPVGSAPGPPGQPHDWPGRRPERQRGALPCRADARLRRPAVPHRRRESRTAPSPAGACRSSGATCWATTTSGRRSR